MAKRFSARETALNGICAYFTMFPLGFPLGILMRWARAGSSVLDPFCGRGTTSFAARLLGMRSLGVDSSPVAAAITASKVATASIDEILQEAHVILGRNKAKETPQGEFWNGLFHSKVLASICKFREAFLEDCSTSTRCALRGVVLGALHGPKQKEFPSYFSNQCPRTYAPKPAYAVRFWRDRGFVPEPVNVFDVIERRTRRYYGGVAYHEGAARQADSRVAGALEPEEPQGKFDWVITSPPYYGLRTYISDQWLRNWFVGGPEVVDYNNRGQVAHLSPDEFAGDLWQVWRNSAYVCADDAKLVVRFGTISDRKVDPIDLIKASLKGSGWRITTIRSAGSAMQGKRQANAFLRKRTTAMLEYDVWARRR